MVTSPADSGPGSLRETIATSAPGDFIVFGVTGTISLTSGELTIAKDLTILGPGREALALSGSHLSRVFRIANEVTVAISDLAIINGHAAYGSEPGGGIFSQGVLSVSNCIIAGNTTADGDWYGGSGGDGGGIHNLGTLLLINSSIMSNATGRGWMQNTNWAAGGSGGGLFNGGPGFVTGCTFESNRTGRGGDGVYGPWSGTVGGQGGDGGAICSHARIELVNCILRENHCGGGGKGGDAGMFSMDGGGGGRGGGIYAASDLTMTGCTIAANTTGAGGEGGAASSGFLGQGGHGGSGGGIAGPFSDWNGTLVLTNCTLAGNRAGEGGYDALAKSTGGSGGAIYACWSNHVIVSCTIVSNSIGFGGVSGRDGLGGGICFDVVTKPIAMNDLVAQNVGPRFGLLGAGPDILGAVASAGHNLIGATNGTVGFTMPGDLTGSLDLPLDPKTGPLADNGGPTWTMALRPGSPAIEAGTPLGSPLTDQRGITRPQGIAPDIGAYEFEFAPRIINARRQSPSAFWVKFCGLPNHFYALQTSTNLMEWSAVTNLCTGADGLREFTCPDAGDSTKRFYRTKALDSP